MIKAMKDFQIPMRVEVDKDTHSQTFGRFTTEAYERGFGTTVGNALRRVLLSSLTGAAVTTVKIEGSKRSKLFSFSLRRARRPIESRMTSEEKSTNKMRKR